MKYKKDAPVGVPVRIAVFDIIRLNGQDVIKEPLQKRLDILNKSLHLAPSSDTSAMVHQSDSILIQGNLTIKEKTEIFEQALDRSLLEGYEGLILKYLDQEYISGCRGWFKYKKDYGDKSFSDTLDLLVVGATLGNGNRSQFYGSFLLAALNEQTGNYDTVTFVGTGMDRAELGQLRDLLQPLLINEPQMNYNLSQNVKSSVDVWFKPGVIVEVKGMEYTKSPHHTSGWSVRFPKLVRIRDDKLLNDVTSVQQMSIIAGS